jgi:hypothetical protein
LVFTFSLLQESATMLNRVKLAPRGAVSPIHEPDAIDLVEQSFADSSTTIELFDTRPLHHAKHYIEIARPVGTLPPLQLFALKWVFIGDAIGVYAKNFTPAQYEYYILQNYCSILTGDSMSYAKIVQMEAGTSWLEQVYKERRAQVEERFIISFNEVYADLSEQMSGVVENDPHSPLGQFIQRHMGGSSGSGGWATSR